MLPCTTPALSTTAIEGAGPTENNLHTMWLVYVRVRSEKGLGLEREKRGLRGCTAGAYGTAGK